MGEPMASEHISEEYLDEEGNPIGGAGGVSVEDEGTPVTGTPHDTIDFAGAGVTATDAGGGKALITIPGGGGGGGPGGFNHISERWYGPQPFDAGEMLGVGTNDCFALPFFVPESGDYDGFGIKSGGESGSVKGYIYDAGDGGKPKTQLKDFGSGSTSGGATELLSSPVTLPQGSAYMVCIFSGLSINLFRLKTSVPSFLDIPFGSGTFGSEAPFYGFNISGASFSSGLPSDISGLSKVQTGTIPIMNLRKD